MGDDKFGREMIRGLADDLEVSFHCIHCHRSDGRIFCSEKVRKAMAPIDAS